MRTRASCVAALVLMMCLPPVPTASAGDAPPAKAPEGPWETYRAYLGATHGGDFEPYLTDEGLAQWRGFSAEARQAARDLLDAPPGLYDATLVGSKVTGNHAQLDAIVYFDPGMGKKDEIKARVELVRGDRGWGVLGETLTPPAVPPFYASALRDAGRTTADGSSWTGLRAPGVFPPTVQAKADAKLRDLREGDEWAVADVRTVISGEAAYQAANNGYYDRIECLLEPSKCVPGYPRDGAPFLDARFAAPRNGYRPRLDLGARADAGPQGSPSSVLSYAYWLIPDPGRAGRTVCGDATGIVCTLSSSSTAPPVTKGACPIEPGPCVILR